MYICIYIERKITHYIQGWGPPGVIPSYLCWGTWLVSQFWFVFILIPYLHVGADVQKGKYWDTPLHAAAQQYSTEIVNLLLEFGADINAKNTELLRPVDVATSSSLVERLLLQHEGKNTCTFKSTKIHLPEIDKTEKLFVGIWADNSITFKMLCVKADNFF